jgi:hypothetical protein
MSDAAPLLAPGVTTEPAGKRGPWRIVLEGVCLVAVGVLFCGWGLGLFSLSLGGRPTQEAALMQASYSIRLAMEEYAHDHDQAFPDGTSSTEVFQKLVDGNYVVDPGIFYAELPGKNKGAAGQKLKPENVCFDVTGGVGRSAPADLPLVFLTGYRVTYAADGSAMPLGKPVYRVIAGSYTSTSADFMKLGTQSDPDGVVHHFIGPGFVGDGKAYRQLTPEGPLP